MREKSFLYLLLFPIFPLISINGFLLATIFDKVISKKSSYLLITLIALYLGLINGTKVLESDLLFYSMSFETIKELNLFEYIISQGKEPIFYFLNYLLFYLTFGNFTLYIVLLTSISYTIYLISIYKFGIKLGCAHYIIITVICIAALFPQLFSLSAHLVRQFLATSILCYILVQKFMYDKSVWHILIIASFIHSTIILFIPLIYISYLSNNIKLSRWALISFFSVFAFLAVPIISNFILNFIENPIITYVFERAAQVGGTELESLSLFAYTLIILVIIITIFINYSHKIIINKELHIVNISILVAIFVLVNLGNTEWALRFFFYIYFFTPYLLFFVFKKIKQNLLLVCVLILIIMNALFMYGLEYGRWEYVDLNKLFFGNIYTILR